MRLGSVRSFPSAATSAEATMTGSVRPVRDCPEPCACYAEGYTAGKDMAYSETRAVPDSNHSGTECTGQ